MVIVMNFGVRLDTYIKKAGISVDEFSKKIQFSRAQVYRYLKNETDPPVSFLTAIKNEFEWVNIDWLVTGEGNFIVAETQPQYDQERNIEVKVYALAGAGQPNELVETESVAEIVIPRDFYKPSIVPVKIRGRSMEDTIMDGAIVGVDRDDTWVISGEVYAVWIPYEGAVVKRLYLDTEKITCRSDNSKFADFVVPLDRAGEHFIQGRVKWVIQRY